MANNHVKHFGLFCVCLLTFTLFIVDSTADNVKPTINPTDSLNATPSVPPPSSVSPTEATEKVTETAFKPLPVVVEKHLLGVNGSGQRKDYLAKPAVVSEPIVPSKIPDKPLLLTPKVNPGILGTTDDDDDDDDIDVSEEETFNINEDKLKNKGTNHNITKFDEEFHRYYNSTVYIDKDHAEEHWSQVTNFTVSSVLSKSHRRAMTVHLSFDFPFYGHAVRNVTVATGGFIYTGDYVHSWLAATQYIAPLMANFDTTKSDDSYVKFSDNSTAFTVVWENVYLHGASNGNNGNSNTTAAVDSPFTFSATLHKNGDIVFIYHSVPVDITSIRDDQHPVKVGLSDAYIIDKTIFFARRKTIYEYHKVQFESVNIQNNTIVRLTALPTCVSFTDCVSCVTSDLKEQKCSWCPAMNACSTGLDRKRQEWINKKCDKLFETDADKCPALGTPGNDAKAQKEAAENKSTEAPKNGIPIQTSDTDSTDSKESDVYVTKVSPLNQNADTGDESKMNATVVLGFLIPIVLIVTLLAWVGYAYRNPHTKSGQLLIQYRPSQWSWRRRGEARYTAATIHM